jgi:archaellum biogenesis ATPase FlaH
MVGFRCLLPRTRFGIQQILWFSSTSELASVAESIEDSGFLKDMEKRRDLKDHHPFESRLMNNQIGMATLEDIQRWHYDLMRHKDILSGLRTHWKIHEDSLRLFKAGIRHGGHGTEQLHSGSQLVIPFFGDLERSISGGTGMPWNKGLNQMLELRGFVSKDLNGILEMKDNMTENPVDTFVYGDQEADVIALGSALIRDRLSEVWVLEDEFDALLAHSLAKWKGFSRPAFSSVLVCKHRRNGIVDLIRKHVMPETKIHICLRDDQEARTTSISYAERLGKENCYIMRLAQGNPKGPKTFTEAVKQDWNSSTFIAKPHPALNKDLLTFQDVREQVQYELTYPGAIRGIPSRTLPGLTRIIKGLRLGEFTIFTGPTGVGKTSILSQLSLDFCAQGMKTLWGSFEIKSPRLVKNMLHQFAGKNMEDSIGDFNEVAEKFRQLPLYFMGFYGGTSIDKVLETIEYAVLVNGVQHVIIDNLQFMMNNPGSVGYVKYDRFEAMDQIIYKFRTFASNFNIHLSIVIHPRKENDDLPLSTNSVYGSAKATQEADNVIVIQKGKEKRYLEVLKNRFDGDTGSICFNYNRDSHMVSLIFLSIVVT